MPEGTAGFKENTRQKPYLADCNGRRSCTMSPGWMLMPAGTLSLTMSATV